MRIMGIDYGSRRIGVAISDATGTLASGLETIRWNGRDPEPPVARICALAEERGVTEIVVGLPARTDGRHGPSEDHARELAERIRTKTGLPVRLRDERFTTVIATQRLRASGMKPGKQRDVVDQAAAEVILQEYLDRRRDLPG